MESEDETIFEEQDVITTQPEMNPENQKKKDGEIAGPSVAEIIGDVSDGIADGIMFNALLDSSAANASGADCGNCGDCGDCDCDCCGPDDCNCDCDCGDCDCDCDCGDCGGCDCGGCGDCTIL